MKPAPSRVAGTVIAGLLALAIVERATAGLAPWLRMIALVLVTLAWMKILVVARTGARLGPAGWSAYVAWFGMHPRPFLRRRSRPAGAPRIALRRGLVALLVGVALVAAARAAAPATPRWAVDAVALIGLSAALHFGIFRLVESALPRLGYPVAKLFDAPWRSRSLAEFWSRRWNRGFAEMTAIVVLRPLARRAPRAARFCGFVCSGLLHELAISVPVGAGFGGPLGYFVLHGLLVEVEARASSCSRSWTFAALILPVPLLFHRAFRDGVLAPLLGM